MARSVVKQYPLPVQFLLKKKASSLPSGFYHDFLHNLHSSGMLDGKSSWLYLTTTSFLPNPSLETILKLPPAHGEAHLLLLLCCFSGTLYLGLWMK